MRSTCSQCGEQSKGPYSDTAPSLEKEDSNHIHYSNIIAEMSTGKGSRCCL